MHKPITRNGRKFKKKRSKNSLNSRILSAWDMFEDQDPDISTERLFAMVEGYIGNGINAGHISSALYQRHIEGGGVKS